MIDDDDDDDPSEDDSDHEEADHDGSHDEDDVINDNSKGMAYRCWQVITLSSRSFLSSCII